MSKVESEVDKSDFQPETVPHVLQYQQQCGDKKNTDKNQLILNEDQVNCSSLTEGDNLSSSHSQVAMSTNHSSLINSAEYNTECQISTQSTTSDSHTEQKNAPYKNDNPNCQENFNTHTDERYSRAQEQPLNALLGVNSISNKEESEKKVPEHTNESGMNALGTNVIGEQSFKMESENTGDLSVNLTSTSNGVPQMNDGSRNNMESRDAISASLPIFNEHGSSFTDSAHVNLKSAISNSIEHNVKNIADANNLNANSNSQNDVSKASSIHGFNQNTSNNGSIHNSGFSNPMMFPMQLAQNHNLQSLPQQNVMQPGDNMSKDAYNPMDRCEKFMSQGRDILSQLGSMNPIENQPLPFQSNSLSSALPGGNLVQHPYDNQIGNHSNDFPNTASCYEPVINRRARGRPRGSKNGTGMGRGKSSYMRGGYRFHDSLERSPNSYDLRHGSDPFGTARRGRPRSRFIVDLGEQNHEAWTKTRIDLNITDAELTTLLLSLLESRRELEDAADNDAMLGLIGAEYNKWKDKFSSQLSMLTHFTSSHNVHCSGCLGLKKKKLPVYGSGTGKRGRPRKYPPPVGYGPGMQRPDTIDEDGNMFEPQCILKDGTIVKAEPNEDKLRPLLGELANHGEAQISGCSQEPITSPMMDGLPPRAMLTHEEMQKRREYYSNHKNKIKYVCHFCQIHFYHKPNFDYHISKLEQEGKCRVYNKVNNLYLCNACGEGFSWREKLEKHLRLAEQHGTHNQKELLVYGDFQCNMCGKTFNKRNTYLQHVKWHETREDIPCVICASMFKQTDLRRHLIEAHNNDSLPCSYCGKLFASRKHLEKHELVHQSGNFPCPECGKCFSQKIAMQHHLRSHSLDKEYSCEHCAQMYTQRLGLCHHLRSQLDPEEFPHECTHCTIYFASSYDLLVHRRKIHNIVGEEMEEEPPPESYLPLHMRNIMQAGNGPANAPFTGPGVPVKNDLSQEMCESVDMSLKHTMNDAHSSLRLAHSNEDPAMREGNLNNMLRMNHPGAQAMRENGLVDEAIRNNLLREQQSVMNASQSNEGVHEPSLRNTPISNDSMREEHAHHSNIREENLHGSRLHSNVLPDTEMQEESSLRDESGQDLSTRDDQQMRGNALLVNEHMRHIMERRHNMGPDDLRVNQNLQDDRHHMPQDLSTIASLSHMTADASRNGNAQNNNIGAHNLSEHVDNSPGRLSDASGNGHMHNEQLGRMAVENFSRMTNTPGVYLAEHLRRMAENQSRSSAAAISDSSMGGHYEDRDYLRSSMSRSMGIRPGQGQWPPHIQGHSPLENMSAASAAQSNSLYSLPFWPYDPSLRHYNH